MTRSNSRSVHRLGRLGHSRLIAMSILAASLAGAFLVRSGSEVQAEPDVRLKITSEGYAKIRIGFEEGDPRTESRARPLYDQFVATVVRDLEMSGYFEPVIDSKSRDLSAVVETSLRRADDNLTFDVRLGDKLSEQTIFKRKYGSAPADIATTAHIVADDIVYAMTGRPGIANTRIAFVAGPKGNSHIYMAGLDGSAPEMLTHTGTIVMSPAWSADGARLAYVSYEQGMPAIYVMDVSNLARTRFASFEGMNATPAWSPDGRHMALTLSKDGNPEIYVVALDGSSERRVTFFSGIDCSPSWAPNGLEVAFTSDRAGTPQIFVTDLEGLNTRQITTEGSYNTSPAWSPDGSLIAYVSRIEGKFQVCTIDPFGVSPRVLTTGGNNEDPKWSADGMHLVFSSTGDGNSGIYLITRDGGDKRRVIDGLERPRSPVWSPPLGYGKQPPVEG